MKTRRIIEIEVTIDATDGFASEANNVFETFKEIITQKAMENAGLINQNGFYKDNVVIDLSVR